MIIQKIPESYRDIGIDLDEPGTASGKHFPDFLIIGPWRTGTTWLSEVLRAHPQVMMSRPKEPLYFSSLRSHGGKSGEKGFLWYLSLFDGKKTNDDRLRGEASATYASSLDIETIRFIHAMNPDVKIIFGVRNPVQRAWSHAKMNIQSEPEVFQHLEPAAQINKALSRQYIQDAGFYSAQLDRWSAVIPLEQICLYQFAHIEEQPDRLFSEICRFLEISYPKEAMQILKSVGRVAMTSQLALPLKHRKALENLYRDEPTRLKANYNIDVASTPVDKQIEVCTVFMSQANPRYSETFIVNHIKALGAAAINVQTFLPLSASADQPFLKKAWTRYRAGNNKRRFLRHLAQSKGPILVEYGTTAAKALPVLRLLQRRIVVHFHGYDAHKQEVLDQFREAYIEIFSLADAIVVVSRHMRQVMLSYGAPVEKLHHIACGVDPAVFRAVDVSTNPPVFFACGRFVEKKAPHLTIRAFHKAWCQRPEMRLRIAGDGRLKSMCQELISSLGMDEAVQLLGIIDHGSVAQEFAKCRAFLQHSITAPSGDSEGTPVGVMEAMCSAVPVIATRHAGIGEVVENQVTGILVHERDVDAMAGAILHLADHPLEAARLGKEARKTILEHHTQDLAINKLYKLLWQ